ncbi:MAG: restriction endonuclease subunit S [bacterium]|nr:restriction endonuclease subunit S [bacterium]
MTSPIDLNPRSLQTVERILADYVPHCEVRAYGSRAKWEAKDYSDLDLAVVGAGKCDGRILGDLREAFEESDLPIRVEVVDWHAIDDAFRSRIEPDCVVIQQPARTADWREFTIGDWSPFSYGRGLPERSRNPTGATRVYGSNGPVGYHDCSLTEGPTVIIGRKGTVGAVHYSPDPCWPIDTTFYIEGDDPTTQRFVYYALLAAGLSTMNSDSAVPGLSREAVHAKEILLPPLEDQHAISRVLGALDDKIELNTRMSETLGEIARALFRSWFVDFDPVHAKAEGRPTGLPSEIDELFPCSFESSELGKIPTGWQVHSLSNIASFTNGLALQRFPPTGDSWLPVIKIAEMRRGYTDQSTKASAEINPKFVVYDGDVIFSWSGSLEVVLWAHGRGALNQHLFKVTSRQFPRWFYWNWLQEHLDELRRIAASKATTMGHIQRHHLDEAKVVVPPELLLFSKDLPLPDIIERQLRHSVQSRTLATIRDTLLPNLLSGELRVQAAA